MPDLEAHMHKLAKAAKTGPENHVYVMRDVLTALYRQGFEDGRAAEHRDQGVARRLAQETENGDAHA